MSDEEQLAALAVTQPPPTTSGVTHFGVKCQKCGASPMVGIRYKCSVCFDFDYCQSCEEQHYDKHPRQHLFLKVRHPLPNEPGLFSSIGGTGPISDGFFLMEGE